MNAALELETIDLSLISACGGFDINWRKVGEYVAPLMPYGTGAPLMNKGAAAQGAVWAAGGALAGSPGGPVGVAMGAAGGGLAGYYGALLGRDIPTT
jgi:hypothetical protein